jgi:hypothetical protein
MENDDRIYALRFGEVAVKRGFITASQVQEALAEQISNEPSIRLRPPKLIGEILLEKGFMTNEQVLTVLKELS